MHYNFLLGSNCLYSLTEKGLACLLSVIIACFFRRREGVKGVGYIGYIISAGLQIIEIIFKVRTYGHVGQGVIEFSI